jgi:hypothetical protein
MYVDEVGNADMKSASDPNHRFLSLTGVILSLNIVRSQLHPEFEILKSEFFDHHPDEPIIFHRKEIMNRKRPFEALRDQNTREQFDDKLLNIISKTDFTMLTVVLDKLEHKKRYGTWRYDPYHYCMAALFEGFVLFLDRKQLRGDVMAEARGGKEDIRLKKAFRDLCECGTEYIEPNKFANVLTSKELKLKLKDRNIPGLQLADLLAHASRREILLEKGKIEDRRKNIFAERVTEILKSKYDQRNGEIYGIGKKFLP